MPLTLSPKQVAETYEIISFEVNIREQLLTVRYEVGPAPVRTASFVISTSVLGQLKPSSSLTYYANLKALLYQKGQELGVFPAGVVS